MRTPPFLPFLNGPASLSPGLRPLHPDAWLMPDTEADAWLDEKCRLMRERRADVFADKGIPLAIEETAECVARHTGTLPSGWNSPLEAAAASVSDDLCLMVPEPGGGWQLAAAS